MDREPLDYAGPDDREANPAWGVIITLVCTPIAAFGLLTLHYGVIGAVEMFQKPPPRSDRPTDAFNIVMMFVIGLFCEGACIRWIWVAFKKGK